ncbi:MAG: hypothetical protein U0Y10_07015 [Spirosomataceae bacterium]
MKQVFFLCLMAFRIGYAQTDYLGLPSPGTTAQVFAPGIVSTGAYERDLAIAPDGKSIFWTVVSPKNLFSTVVYRTVIAGKWSETQVAPFSGQYSDLEPAFSPDGKRLFFVSNRPLEGKGKPKDFDIWMVEKTPAGWSIPKNLGTPVNTADVDEFYPSVTNNGTLYFTAIYKHGVGKDDLWRANWENGRYTQPELVTKPISTDGYEFNCFVMPDESALYYTSCVRKNGVIECDLVVSHRQADGTWGEPKPLEGIGVNSSKLDYCPVVSPDGKYLFFTSERARNEWNFDKPLSYKELLKQIQAPQNGEADIYWIETKNTDKQ